MASGMTKDGEILEGFLCPICLEDLVSISQLHLHFEEQHGNEDKVGLHAIKGRTLNDFFLLFLYLVEVQRQQDIIICLYQ